VRILHCAFSGRKITSRAAMRALDMTNVTQASRIETTRTSGSAILASHGRMAGVDQGAFHGIRSFSRRQQRKHHDHVATDSNHSDTGDDTTWIPWITVVVPPLALLPTLAAYFIGWGAIAGTH